MVTFWPWRGDDNSPASFEKTLSTLSGKIAKTTTRIDGFRQRSRRWTVLWTLYSGFAYLLCSIILILVVGWRNWGPSEYAAVASGPAFIYFVRLALTTYYEYRTSLVQSHLDDLQSQRDGQVEKLKIATKYNSTQELLKKYGGTPTPKSKSATNSDRKVSPKQSGPSGTQGGRTGFVPPPTANIPGRNLPPTGANTPQNSTPQIRVPAAPLTSPPRQAPMSPRDLTADFAPNAFSASPQYAQTTEDSRWYDRIMDVLLGEDETLPAKRLALICGHCRLVNGQAPPGLKRLEDVGKWRCWGCRAMNGEETEAAGLVAGIKEQAASTEEDPRTKEPTDPELGKTITNEEADSASADGEESDVTQYSSRDSEIEKETGKPKTLPKPVVESETPRRRSTRPKKSSKETE